MALSWFVCGSAQGNSGLTTLVIPITTNVPRSDPILGGTVILIYAQSVPGGSTISSIVDDATPQDSYSFCIFDDGLNHYGNTQAAGVSPNFGVTVNDLVAGTNSITITMDAPTWFEAAAIAITGVGSFVSPWPTSPPAQNPDVAWLPTVVDRTSTEFPVGGGTSSATGMGWTYDMSGNVVMVSPASSTDAGWDWIDGGDLALYELQTTAVSDIGAWSWSDGAISDFTQWDVDTGVNFVSMALGAQSPVVGGVAAPSLAGSWATLGTAQGTGQGIMFVAGTGPLCSSPPPSGIPVFDHRFRLLDSPMADFGPISSPCFNARIRLQDATSGSGGSTAPTFNNRTRLTGDGITIP